MAEQNLVPHSPECAARRYLYAGSMPPNQAGPGHAGSAHHQETRNAGRIPSRDECLRAVNQVANLLLMGVVTTSQPTRLAPPIRPCLISNKSNGVAVGRQLDDQGLLSVLRSHPELAGHLEPLLSDEQIAMLMEQAREDRS